jgi:hypothetical protein
LRPSGRLMRRSAMSRSVSKLVRNRTSLRTYRSVKSKDI